MGKGAFGQVYRTYCSVSVGGIKPDHGGALLGALNWATGETVAIKEIQLSNIPKSEIGQIMVSSSAVIDMAVLHGVFSCAVRDQLVEELERTSLYFRVSDAGIIPLRSIQIS